MSDIFAKKVGGYWILFDYKIHLCNEQQKTLAATVKKVYQRKLVQV